MLKNDIGLGQPETTWQTSLVGTAGSDIFLEEEILLERKKNVQGGDQESSTLKTEKIKQKHSMTNSRVLLWYL